MIFIDLIIIILIILIIIIIIISISNANERDWHGNWKIGSNLKTTPVIIRLGICINLKDLRKDERKNAEKIENDWEMPVEWKSDWRWLNGSQS